MLELATSNPDGTARLFSYFMVAAFAQMQLRCNQATEPEMKRTLKNEFLAKPIAEVWNEFVEVVECKTDRSELEQFATCYRHELAAHSDDL